MGEIDIFVSEIEDILNSLKETLCNSESITAKWNAVDTFMMDIERLQLHQPITGRKSFKGLHNGEDVEGNTRYLSHLAAMPIKVNSIINEDESLSPSDVCEMHVGNIDGEICLLITPTIIGR